MLARCRQDGVGACIPDEEGAGGVRGCFNEMILSLVSVSRQFYSRG